MTIQEYVAQQTERAGEILAYALETTPADKLDWTPAVEGSAPLRSAYQQVGECVIVNRFVAARLRGEEIPPMNQWPEPTFTDSQDAQAQLIASAKELAVAIAAMPDTALEETFQMRRGPTKGASLIMMPYRNMSYHFGQINLYQLLLGDPEFHVSPKFY